MSEKRKQARCRLTENKSHCQGILTFQLNRHRLTGEPEAEAEAEADFASKPGKGTLDSSF